MNFNFKVNLIGAEELERVLGFLTGYFPKRDFVEELRREVDGGRVEIFAVESGEGIVGVAVVAYRLSVSLQAWFASVEELYVSCHWRDSGVGRGLLEARGTQCSATDVSYVEVQTDEEVAGFYEAGGYEHENKVKVYSISYPLGDQSSRTS
jgi:N-acetylglutamate synthase-like GNAT family acetyltransferase